MRTRSAIPARFRTARIALRLILLSLTCLETIRAQTPDSFNPGAGSDSVIALQGDGKILVGATNGLRRLNSDGTLDATFIITVFPTVPGSVNCLLIQDDGRIVVGGSFLLFRPQTRASLGRLNPDGALDPTFNVRADNAIYSLAQQQDGKLLVGGAFTNVAGQAHSGLARLNRDGTLDSSFNPVVTPMLPRPPPFRVIYPPLVYGLSVESDGKIIVGGVFIALNGVARTNIGRLNPDGSLDASFAPKINSDVNFIQVQPDGKILVAAQGSGFGSAVTNVWRFNSDGTIDSGFNATGNNPALSLLLQNDGKILVGGNFSTLDGQARKYLARLNSDGTLDSNFVVQVSGLASFNYPPNVSSLALQSDGKLIVSGVFTNLGGQSRTNIGRLNNTALATEALSFDATAITWLRGGPGPEVWRTTFDLLTSGMDWINLGEGTRINGGWQLSGVSIPSNSTLRARGFTTGGQYTSSWFIETGLGPPAITVQPAARTNLAMAVSGFSVQALGTPPLTYQWRKDGMDLADGGNLSGTHSSTLTVSNVLGADAGAYFVIISNSFGALTSQLVTLSVVDPLLTTQPVSQTTNAGATVTFTSAALGSAPLAYQWYRNGTNLSGATAPSLSLTNVQRPDAGSYQLVVSNGFGSVTSSPAILTINFSTLDSFGSGAEGYSGSTSVSTLALQPDNKILVSGSFTNLSGQICTNIGRLAADGTLDTSFIGSTDSALVSLALQEDGRILIGGRFYTLAGQSRYNLGRLNADGSFDNTFDLAAYGGLDGVNCLVSQPDGAVLIGGGFYSLGGQGQQGLGRFFSDGILDANFAAAIGGFFASVYSLVPQSDGKVVVGGRFTSLSGQSCTNIGRVAPDGTADPDFNSGADGPVYCLALQPDGKILVGGSFTNLGGQLCTNIGRLNPDGTFDSAFSSGANGAVFSLALQTDGRILAGGSFTLLAGQTRKYLGRLNGDGTPDPIFDPGADAPVNALLLQPNGKILIGGSFTNIAGQKHKAIARLNNTDGALEVLSFDSSSITWMRGGASPQILRAVVDVSTNGNDWFRSGEATTIAGGWKLAGITVPPNAAVRARGFLLGGLYNGSSGFVETSIGPASISLQPVSRTNNADTVAAFSVTAAGAPPFSYQWRKGDTLLSDVANVSGAQTAGLTLSNVFGIDAGDFSVIVSNASGTVTSRIASLTVIDPLITSQPASQSPNAAENVLLKVTAIGTPPLSYQWRKDGVNLQGATAASLAVSNVQRPDIGRYDVLISNQFSIVTSVVALLEVNFALPTFFNPQANNEVDAIALQPNGKILLGGNFTTLSGQPCNRIGRLNRDGTFDATFNPGANNTVSCLAVQSDRKILLGGNFTTVAGQTRNYLARLNPDGLLDGAFNPGADFIVNCLALQPDGKILVGGDFRTLGGSVRNYLGRLNPDGTLDASFNPVAASFIYTIAVQPDGRILVGGAFTSLAGQPRNYLARLAPDGTLDDFFDPGPNNFVYALALQPNGQILVGGYFTSMAGSPCSRLCRLETDGTLDNSFAAGADGTVTSVTLQTDGKILLGGDFSTVNSQPRNTLARIDSDGALDLTFNPAHDRQILCLALQDDGQILVGGNFTNLASQARSRIGRLSNTAPANQTLASQGSTITWFRSGTSPEVVRTSFDVSTNGSDWATLGLGTRISGGWQLSGASVSANSFVRARGFLNSGLYNGSAWFVETQLLPAAPTIVVDDSSFGYRFNQFTFNTRALPGQAVIIETTTGYLNWIPLQTNRVTSAGIFYFSDPDSATFPKRFYRARLYFGPLP